MKVFENAFEYRLNIFGNFQNTVFSIFLNTFCLSQLKNKNRKYCEITISKKNQSNIKNSVHVWVDYEIDKITLNHRDFDTNYTLKLTKIPVSTRTYQNLEHTLVNPHSLKSS